MIKNFLIFYLKKLPLTKLKLLVANFLYRLVKLFIRNDIRTVTRKGIRYELDLSEGIDLSLYIFRNFQNHITGNRYIKLPKSPVILDIGANIGSMALSFAATWEKSIVYALEPSDYSYQRLLTNLELNPRLKNRINPFKIFMSDTNHQKAEGMVYSSWKIDKKHKNRHPVHGGIKTLVTQVKTLTLDVFCNNNDINHIDLIKIDTDGHEYRVLKGAETTLQTKRPIIIFEIGIYIMLEQKLSFKDYYSFLNDLNYNLFSIQDNLEITLENFQSIIPTLSTIDIIAIPKKIIV